MGLYEDLMQSVYNKALNTPVEDIRIGTTWTGVLSSKLGLSLTFSSFYDNIEEAGTLKEKPASHLLEYLKSFNFLKLSAGLATLNSLIEPPKELEKFNILDFLKEKGIGKKIVLIGHFCGLEDIRASAKELIILERNPKEGDLPDTASEYIIPQADIVAITGSSFANKSVERLLQLSKGLTIVFGPSTPLSAILFDYGVDIIGGSIAKDTKFILDSISQGAHLDNFKRKLDYVVMRKNK